MIERLLPPGAVAAELFDDEPTDLFPEEEAAIARAVGKRRREFTSVRVCARRALAELGQPPAPLVPGERGAPQWPDGIVGSMTHCDGYRACVLARSADFVSIGLDAEPNLPLPDGVDRMVCLPEEKEHIAALTQRSPGVWWDRLLFCAKESVYKAWFPVTRTWLGFESARIEFAETGTFTARILIEAPITGFTGRWLSDGGHIVTLITNPGALCKSASRVQARPSVMQNPHRECRPGRASCKSASRVQARPSVMQIRIASAGPEGLRE